MAEPEDRLIEGRTGKWEIVIGMEVHAQVAAKSKLFSGASTEFGAEPNTQVSLVDAAMPGMLPVINEFAVEQAVRTGLGLNAQINLSSVFDRKNYFYPDLPQGYQISQFTKPVVGTGKIIIDLADGTSREVGITRLHLEQDAGKSLHDQHPKLTYIDLNRSGQALMEIVSEPDMRSAEEAGAYLKKLRSILRYLGTCDGNMEEGSMRADVNVSVRKPGDKFGTRCEIKNVNSIRFVQQAVEYEARRQIELIEDGGVVKQQTRLFDANRGETRPMRSKEEAHDYRYFPDPDLLPLELDEDWVKAIERSLPELPDAKKTRFVKKFGLKEYDAAVLVSEKENADFYERALREKLLRKYGELVDIMGNGVFKVRLDDLLADPDVAIKNDEIIWTVKASAVSVANVVTQDVFGALNRTGLTITGSPVSAENVAILTELLDEKVISGRMKKDVFEIMWDTKAPPDKIVKEKNMVQITDTGPIEAAADTVIAGNPDQVAKFKGGNDKLIGWFVGQVMKATGGKANPQVVNEILRKKLAG